MGHPNSKKHKREHCGYKKRPSKKKINALLDMYKDIDDAVKKPKNKKEIQLKLNF